MTKIHITEKGKAVPCNASIRDCPRGTSNHFESMEEAVMEIEDRKFAAKKKPKVTEEPVETPMGKDPQGERSYEESIREADAEVQVEPVTAEEQARWFVEGLAKLPFDERAVAVKRFASGKHKTVHELVALRAELHRYSDRLSDQLDYSVDDLGNQKWLEYRDGWYERQLADKAAARAVDDLIPYTQQEVNDLAFEELRKSGLLSEGWTIAHGHQVRALATTFYGTRQIQFSNLWTPVLSKTEMMDTITHEVAHAKVGTGYGHDETWQAAHREMGGSGEEKHHSEDPVQKDAYRERFKKFYPNGLKGGTHGGVSKKELDPAMIEALKYKFQGKFEIPFDESGLSIPELLQMAQKGELD